MSTLPTTENKRGVLALVVAHCAGMIDLIGLPVWVGSLISQYKFDPQQAGGLVTLFLIGASVASFFFAPRFTRTNQKVAAVSGFFLATVAFALSSQNAAFPILAVLHFIGGLSAGTALSFTHGTIGHAANPHRTFAYAGLALGIFGIIFLGATPNIVAKFGGPSLFYTFVVIMGIATLMTLLFFPKPTRHIAADDAEEGKVLPPLGRAVWLLIIATGILSMAQAMTLSFFERVGMERGFGLQLVTGALIIYGICAVFPAPIAAILEKRIPATAVISTMPILQAICSVTAMTTTNYVAYAISGGLMAFTIIFVHTYAFGLMVRIDPTGRAVAGTPAMLMIGSAIAPFIGGTLVKFSGFTAIGIAVTVLVIIQLLLYNSARKIVLRTQLAENVTQANEFATGHAR